MSNEPPVNADTDIPDRRPLASRNTKWAQRLARLLASTAITPNQISYASMVFAAIGCLAFIASTGYASALYAVCMLVAVVACQLRLVCNLMDGLVAIEAGKQTPDGAVWNEFPDRLADIAILAGVGVAAGDSVLGWVAASLAVLVAYVRELGKGIDGVVDFSGPMAKPQRMALVSAGALLSAGSTLLPSGVEADDVARQVLQMVLYILIAGCLLTVVRRVHALLRRLH